MKMEDYVGPSAFDNMIAAITKLHVKYLQQLLNDLKAQGAIHPWTGDYYRMMVHAIELSILERTVLK